MGTVTKSIGSAGGRDYSTIASWESALPANLVTDGNAQVGELYNDSEFTVTATIAIAGSTTDATNFITLKCAAGQSFRDNANVQTNGLRYNASNGVGIRKTTNYSHVITCGVNYTVIDGLQISHRTDADSGTGLIANDGASGDYQVWKNLLCQYRGNSSTQQGGISFGANCRGGTAINCIVIANTSTAVRAYYTQGNNLDGHSFINCVAVRCSNKTIGGTAFHAQYGPVTKCIVKNCAGFGFTNFFNDTTKFNASCDYNASDTTIGIGSNNQASKTYSATKPFVQADSTGTLDFRVTSASDADVVLIDKGTTDTSASPDIAKTTRPSGSAYDIGCWEVVAASDLATKPVNVNQAVHRSYSY